MHLMGLGFKRKMKNMVAFLSIFIFLFGFIGANNLDTASAKTDYSPPATELKVMLNNNGNITHLATYTISDLQQMRQVRAAYTSMDRMPAPNFTAAEGILLRDFLSRLNIDINSVEKFKFTATDDYCSRISKQELLDTPRYYFPRINECFDADNYPVFNEGAKDGKTPVEPILALRSYQERFLNGPRYENMDGTDVVRLCFGQKDVSECTNSQFVRWVKEIEITGRLLPAACNGKVELSTPTAGQTFKAGEEVKIGGIASNLPNITISVIAPDGHTAYTAKNLEVLSGSFNTDFTLEDDAAEGSYTIKIRAAQLSSDYTASFRVEKSSVVIKPVVKVELSTPTAGQSYQAGDKVSIAGTTENLETVELNVIAPDGLTVCNQKSLNTQSGSFSSDFTLKKDAAEGSYTIKIRAAQLSSDYTRSFTVEKSSVVIKPVVKIEPSTPTTDIKTSGSVKAFSDLDNHWAQKAINELVAKGVVAGVTESEFKPDDCVTRAQFTAMLARALEIDTRQGATIVFKDVPVSAWYHDTVNATVMAGLASGYSNGLFGPDDLITREQMTAIVSRALLIKKPVVKPNLEESTAILKTFTDSGNISAWARTDVALAVLQGIVSEKSDRFLPRNNATRAEAAVMISHLLASL